MDKIINPNKSEWAQILKRPTQEVADIEQTVNQIFDEIRQKGDAAVAKYTELFDGFKMNELKASETEIKEAESQISDELKEAISLAKANIEKFHAAQRTSRVSVETTAGVTCWQEKSYSESWVVYSRRYGAFVFLHSNVGDPGKPCRL